LGIAGGGQAPVSEGLDRRQQSNCVHHRGQQVQIDRFIQLPHRSGYVKFFGTHAEHDQVDATTVDQT